MTINSVTEAWSRRGSSFGSTDGRRFTLSASRGWQVVHSYDATELEILSDSRVDQVGDLYENTYAVCKKKTVSKVGQIMSIVACEFEGESGSVDGDDNPLNAPVEFDWGQTSSTEAIDSDVNGRPIVTANGEQINGVTMELCDSVLNMRKNFSVFTPWIQQQYLHSVNSDVFANFAAGTGKMKSLGAKEMRFKDLQYFEVSASVQFRFPYNTTAAKAWFSRSRHEGYYERKGPVVTFTGGGGSGAAAVAVASSAGVLTGIFVVNGGSGYTSAPTVAISSGSGATATAIVTSGKVSSVSVGSGGTGYKVRIIRAVDDNGEPTSKPVLLTQTGFREYNPANAAWIETEKYKPLPYSALGFE